MRIIIVRIQVRGRAVWLGYNRYDGGRCGDNTTKINGTFLRARRPMDTSNNTGT